MNSPLETITLPAATKNTALDGLNAIDFFAEAPADGSDLFILLHNKAGAFKLIVKGVTLSVAGQFPPEPFFPFGRYLVFRVPAPMLEEVGLTPVRLLLYTEQPVIRLSGIYLVDEGTSEFYLNVVNFINFDVYRYFSFLCFFLFVYFLVHYWQVRHDTAHLYFSLFNLFVAFYYFGTGFVWSGLPFDFFYAFFKACLFLGVTCLALFCFSFTKSGNRILRPMTLSIGVLQFVFLLAFQQDTSSVDVRFRFALVGASIIMIGAFAVIVRQFFRGQHELRPLVAGGLIALAFGLIDVASNVMQSDTLFRLQGFGIFFFLLSVFVAFAKRNIRLHQNLEKYTKTVESEVSHRTSELNTSNQELLRASKAKSAFLAHMSHEIRTPLNGIMGFTQLIEQGTAEASTRYHSGLILKESEHLMQLISHILDFSRIEQGKLELEKKPFAPLDTISAVLEGFGYAAKKKGLQFEFFVSGEMPGMVNGDQVRFQQILVNLIANAIKFTERGFVRIEAKGSLRPELKKTRIEVTVSDSGIGIPADKIETIFQSFEQADASISRKFGGTGLGITIARDLIHLMDGEITVTSIPDQGTRIHYDVLLDYVSPPPIQPKALLSNTSLDDLTFPTDFLVLVVDDYESNIEVLKAFLARAGIACRSARSGQQAIEELKQSDQKVSVILLDIHMPGMDGFETTRRIRMHEKFSQTPIVALTADAYEETRQRCANLGIIEVITKPVRYETLIGVLSKFLGDAPFSNETHPIMAPTDHEQGLVINHHLLLSTYFGEEETIRELLISFSSSGGTVMREIEKALENRQFELIGLRAHAIKGAALNICVQRLAHNAEMLERACKGRQVESITTAWELLQLEWNLFQDAKEVMIRNRT